MREPKLRQLDIVAFRGLRDLHLDELRPVTLLFGPNNCGKTSVLEATAIFCRPMDLRQWLTITQMRDPGRIAESKLVSLRWCFANVRSIAAEEGQEVPSSGESQDTLYSGDIEIQGEGATAVKQVTSSYREILGEITAEQLRKKSLPYGTYRRDELPAFRRGADITTHLTKGNGESLGSNTMTVWEDEPVRVATTANSHSLPVQILNASSYHAGIQLSRWTHQLRSGKYQDVAIAALRNFDPDADGLEIGSASGRWPGIYVSHRRLGLVPVTAFGDGMRRAVALLLGAVAARDGLLLLDEIESGIHFSVLPAILQMLMNVAEELNVQIVATTHSLEAIDATLAATNRLDDVVAYRLPQVNSDQVAAKFPGEALRELRYDGGLEVR